MIEKYVHLLLGCMFCLFLVWEFLSSCFVFRLNWNMKETYLCCLVSLVKCVGVVFNPSQESLWKLQRRMHFILVHWLLGSLMDCWVLGIPCLLCQMSAFSAAEHVSWPVCAGVSQSCLIHKVFLQIHSSADSSEAAFTAEQTLLFYFAFSVIINCKFDKILIIILITIRPCDWGKKMGYW